MNLEDFTQSFAVQFDETEISTFTSSTEFKTLKEWSSLMALSIIAMVDEEYDIKIKGIDIRSSQTIEDLYHIVKSRM